MLKGQKKHTDKEQGKTKHEAPRSVNYRATLENTFALPMFGTYVDGTAYILVDIIKPRDKLRNTPGVPEGTNYENHIKGQFLKKKIQC